MFLLLANMVRMAALTGCDYELSDLLLQSAPSETLLALTSAQRNSKSGLIRVVVTFIFSTSKDPVHNYSQDFLCT